MGWRWQGNRVGVEMGRDRGGWRGWGRVEGGTGEG